MSATGTEERTVDWAVNLFRPLLKDLRIQELKDQSIIFTANYRAFQKYHMDSCIVIVKRYKFSKPNYKGVFIWQYNTRNEIFALYIILNENMYDTTDVKNEIFRKAVSTHEFTHCVAALLTLSRLKTKVLIENQQKKLAKRFHAMEESDMGNLMADISNSMLQPNMERFLFFPDMHFRTGDEDFSQKYSELYRNLLLSYGLFKEYFTDEITTRLKELFKDGNDIEFERLVAEKIQAISKEKRLEWNFVLQSFRNIFIPKFTKELKKF